MDRPLKRIPAHVDNDFSVVSILVLVDRPLKPCLDFASFASSPRVSILVLVDRPLKLPLSRRRKESRTVSILVLVDRPLKLRRQCDAPVDHQRGFNPCSGGSASQTPGAQPTINCTLCVSILVLVDRPLKVPTPPSPRLAPQSCFNPCSGGSASQTWVRRVEERAATHVSILVLVDRPLKRLGDW